MVVKIRFGRGPAVSGRAGRNKRIATLTASCLTLISLSCASFAMWRIGADLEWTGDFVYSTGLLSHWQVWAGLALAIQYFAWRLNRYAKKSAAAKSDLAIGKAPRPGGVIANV
jgi:hypothetical protein